MRKKTTQLIYAAVLVAGTLPLVADEQETHQEIFPTKFTPWFTGPLIAPSAYTVKPGHFDLEPYLYAFVFNGFYDRHWKSHSTPNFYSTRLQLQTKIGLAERLEIRIFPQLFYNETEGRHYTNIGDLPVGIGIQLLKAQVTDPWPAMKLSLRASAPIGKYQHLHRSLKRTDAIGSGSWEPTIALNSSKLWNIAPTHYLSMRLVLTYQFGIPVHVKGLNTYGGDKRTHGTVHVGDNFSVDAAMQYNLTQEWALACDLLYQHFNKNRFSGKHGNAAPSREQWSLAPALEYNWSENLGIIGGVWFTFAGRNCNRYVTGVVAVSIYI